MVTSRPIRSTMTRNNDGADAAARPCNGESHVLHCHSHDRGTETKQASALMHYFGNLKGGLLRQDPGENSRSIRIFAASPIGRLNPSPLTK